MLAHDISRRSLTNRVIEVRNLVIFRIIAIKIVFMVPVCKFGNGVIENQSDTNHLGVAYSLSTGRVPPTEDNAIRGCVHIGPISGV
jgi:hypothetical protein